MFFFAGGHSKSSEIQVTVVPNISIHEQSGDMCLCACAHQVDLVLLVPGF